MTTERDLTNADAPAPLDLPTASGFTETDLQHNRNRRLSPAQRAALQRQFVRKLFSRLAWALVFGYFAWNLFTQSVACQGPVFLLSLVVLFFMFGGVLSDWLVIRDNHVSQIDGEFTRELEPAAHITPAGSTYECDFSGHEFDVTAEAYALLADGERYRLYWVASSRRPLSLEHLPAAVEALENIEVSENSPRSQVTTEPDLPNTEDAAPPPPPAEVPVPPTAMQANPTTSILGPVFDFGESDLRANRQGRLSELQATRLSRRLTLTFIGGAALFAYFGWLARSSPPMAGLMILMLLVVAGGFVKTIREVRTRAVARVEGFIIPKKETGHLRPRYFYEIAGQRLPVTAQAVDKIEAGQRYRVYVEPNSRQILSLERLEQ